MSNRGGEKLRERAPTTAEAVKIENEVALEALQHLWRSIPYGTEFQLSNGLTGKIAKFAAPRDTIEIAVDTDGLPDYSTLPEDAENTRIEKIEPRAGVDVNFLQDGVEVGQIGFRITQAG